MAFTTADLPPDMQYRPDTETARAVRGSGLSITCRHAAQGCDRCIVEAARRVVAAADTRTP